MTYVMHRTGSTTGAVSGRQIRYSAGDEIEAPEGEFAGLPDHAYEKRPTQEGRGDVPRYIVEQSGPWWTVVDTKTGEKVDGESARSKDEAQANADRLNSTDG